MSGSIITIASGLLNSKRVRSVGVWSNHHSLFPFVTSMQAEKDSQNLLETLALRMYVHQLAVIRRLNRVDSSVPVSRLTTSNH